MATADVTQDHVTEQLSGPKVILLALLPGAMVVIFDLLTGTVPDQAALQGILSRIGILNLKLISVTEMEQDSDDVSLNDNAHP